MSTEQRREAWVGKHSVVLIDYQATCPGCEATWVFMNATKNPEVYCPFCENEEPIKTKEA